MTASAAQLATVLAVLFAWLVLVQAECEINNRTYYNCVVFPYQKQLYTNVSFSAEMDGQFRDCCNKSAALTEKAKAFCSHTRIHEFMDTNYPDRGANLTDVLNEMGGKGTNASSLHDFVNCWTHGVSTSACCNAEGPFRVCAPNVCEGTAMPDLRSVKSCMPFYLPINICNSGQTFNRTSRDLAFRACCNGKSEVDEHNLFQCNYHNYRGTGYTLKGNEVWRNNMTTNEGGFEKDLLLCALNGTDYQACCSSKGVGTSCLKFCSAASSTGDETELLEAWPNCQKDWPAMVDCFESGKQPEPSTTMAPGGHTDPSMPDTINCVSTLANRSQLLTQLKTTQKDRLFQSCCDKSSSIMNVAWVRRPQCSFSVLEGPPECFPANIELKAEPYQETIDTRNDGNPFQLFQDYLACLSDSKDNTGCCESNGVSAACLRLCDGERRDPINLVAFTMCSAYEDAILQCHSANAYPNATTKH